MNAPAQLSEVKAAGGAPALIPDQAVDMFTERGFILANRIAKAYASSDAVPAQFRSHNLKKVNGEEIWVENPSAIGNCLVSIEVARAVRMSITAVMQNADMIEGKLRWSGKFVIAAINASGRFTPLRFQMINRGKITAKYKEKTGWNKEARKPIFEDRQVEVDDIECIAWALPRGTPEPRLAPEQVRQYSGRMLDLYRDIGMPVIESAPVSMRMVVEEGWYGKAGSKWQTGLRTLMFQYRAGSFFGNIHAPDIVMGMGRTSEEEADIVDVYPDGSFTVQTTTLDTLRSGPARPAEEVRSTAVAGPSAPADEQSPEGAGADQVGAQAAHEGADGAGNAPQGGFDFDAAGLVRGIREDIESAKTPEDLDLARSAISGVPDETAKAELNALASARMRAITAAAEQAAAGKASSQTTAPAGRRPRGPINAD
ncbi:MULTISPECIES: hypothetical protein [Burkholderia cepacia complex]|uniref:hypothetical protein n=1 Tax=Burkholderia cepacia complex TaxID=87882 RepID=UPI000AFA59BC|nr:MULTISPECIES: hypothetical protein [Burkholderia cepacia complex]UEC01210.1 hypothetical protein LK462_21860 [Burkholderia vietnamiensis]